MRISRQAICRGLTVLAVTALCAGHTQVFAETAEATDHAAHHEPRAFEWPGIYNGFTPCPDCNGVKISLALNANGSYISITQYVGKSPKDFVEKGKYTWDDKTKVITLTPRNSTTTRQFLAGDNQLTELDAKGAPLHPGDVARYSLHRTDFSTIEPKHGGH